MRLCECCELEITAARLAAIPDATLCAICLKIQGDVPMTRGYMSWEHKTAPTIIIGPEADVLRRYDRRGFHAQLPLNNRENPRMLASQNNVNLSAAICPTLPEEDMNMTPATINGSRCHPDRPRVNPRGDCFECAVSWYTARNKS